jgi:FkbM family methyltransferase
MKKKIRQLVNKIGYDIVEIETIDKVYPDVSREEGLSLYNTPIGNYYVPADHKRDVVARSMSRGKVFEREVVDLASQYIKENSIVLDIGANYGQMSVLFSKLVQGKVEVYSFEAQKLVFEILKKNIAINNCVNIKPFLGAVYDKAGLDLVFPEPDFKRFGAYGSYGIEPNAMSGSKVKSLTIDSIQFDKPISFVKIDIQGSDLFAMRGALNTIKGHKMPILFEFEQEFQDEFKTSFQDYVDFVDQIGYKFKTTVLNINYLIVPK